MTKKFEGLISVDGEQVKMPEGQQIPDKNVWFNYAIWEFNGRRFKPLTQKAVDNLADTVKLLEQQGFKGAIKPGKRKMSSIKYAICTMGAEEFTLVK